VRLDDQRGALPIVVKRIELLDGVGARRPLAYRRAARRNLVKQ
jgi:hypothetical protein